MQKPPGPVSETPTAILTHASRRRLSSPLSATRANSEEAEFWESAQMQACAKKLQAPRSFPFYPCPKDNGYGAICPVRPRSKYNVNGGQQQFRSSFELFSFFVANLHGYRNANGPDPRWKARRPAKEALFSTFANAAAPCAGCTRPRPPPLLALRPSIPTDEKLYK